MLVPLVFCFVNIFLECIDISIVDHICHSLKQTENKVKVAELFEDDANYPEPEDATYDKLNDFNEESVQLKVGLINKSPMGVHALYRNICHLQQ